MTPWYVRISHFTGRAADEVTVYVLLGVEGDPNEARFFVVRNKDVGTMVRQPPNWLRFGLIDALSVDQYEDNWDILKL